MSYRIVLQPVKVGSGENATIEYRPAKVIGKAPNETGQPNENGDVEPFINIPPIVRLYIGHDGWGSPEIMPPYEELDAMIAAENPPPVWTLTLNPRTENFNLHHGFGRGQRTDINPTTGEKKKEILKPASGKAARMVDILAGIKDFDRRDATAIVALMTVEMIALNKRIDDARQKRAEKEARKPTPPRKPQRKLTKAELQSLADEQRLLEWAARRKAS